jgi:aminopeptidase YwaD
LSKERQSEIRLQSILTSLEAGQAELLSDFNTLCDFGGRQAGTASEKHAIKWLKTRLEVMRVAGKGGNFRSEPVTYAGWTKGPCWLTLEDGTPLLVNPLLGTQSTPPGGLTAEVLDLGRGTEDDFRSNETKLKGRIALVRHEYMFSSQTIHRRKKLGWAMERGAAGFLIANPEPGAGPVCGSSGRAGGQGIPAAATDHESAQMMAGKTVKLVIHGTDHEDKTEVLILDFPGKNDRWLVLSAHLDGHDLAESALDNASGVAVALAVTRALAPHVKDCERGLRLCLFSAEEWALAGSRQYLDRMDPAERAKMELNINLDTVAGDDHLTALTSDFPELDAWVKKVAKENGLKLGTYLPLMQNSDHANFARHGIPAMRLVAGFEALGSMVFSVLTLCDVRTLVAIDQIAKAANLTALLTATALGDDAPIAQ